MAAQSTKLAPRPPSVGQVNGSETKKAEEAVKSLGSLLGLESDRPDKTKRTGPDVIWRGGGEPFGISFELKTNKKKNGEYSKSDIKDCHDHHQWLQDTYADKAFVETIVGYHLPVSCQANPSDELRIIEIQHLLDLAERVRSTFESVDLTGEIRPEEFERWLTFFGLIWPNCIDSLAYRMAVDLKQ